MFSRIVLGLLVVKGIAGPSHAAGDDAAVTRQIERWALYTVASTVCERIGFQGTEIDSDAFGVAAAKALKASGMNEKKATDLYLSRVDRELKLFRTDSGQIARVLEGEPPFRPAMERWAAKYDAICLEVSKDSIFKTWVTAPPAPARANSRRDFLDKMLEPVGEASWQTPRIVARGDLLATVGACKGKLPRDEADALTDQVLKSIAPGDIKAAKLRDYYNRQLSEGARRSADFGFDEAACRRGIAANLKDAAE